MNNVFVIVAGITQVVQLLELNSYIVIITGISCYFYPNCYALSLF